MKSGAEFELAAPDLSRWRIGNTGVEGVWRFGRADGGPRVALTALVHGNELCGAWAASDLLERMIRNPVLRRGELTIAFCNLAAFERFDPSRPHDSRFVEEDLNRQWSAERLASGNTLERRRAAELRPWLETADFLLDLHSMHEPGSPLLLTGTLPRHVAFVRELGLSGHVVIDAGHADGKRLRDFGRFGEEMETPRTLLIECGFHGNARSRRVAEDAVYRLLRLTDIWEAWPSLEEWNLNEPPAEWALRVTDAVVARSMSFRFAREFDDLEMLAKQGTPIGFDGDESFLTPYDDCVLVMPSLNQLRVGVTVVRLARRVPLV